MFFHVCLNQQMSLDGRGSSVHSCPPLNGYQCVNMGLISAVVNGRPPPCGYLFQFHHLCDSLIFSPMCGLVCQPGSSVASGWHLEQDRVVVLSLFQELGAQHTPTHRAANSGTQVVLKEKSLCPLGVLWPLKQGFRLINNIVFIFWLGGSQSFN